MKKELFAILLLIVFCSCNSSSDSDPKPNSGTITGSVLLFDEGSNAANPSGMKVSVENLSPGSSSLTDNSGKFSLEKVPFGTYSLIFEKEGYGTFKKTEVKHESMFSSISTSPSLGRLSATQIEKLEVKKNGSSIDTYVTTSPAGSINNRRYIRYFFSTTPDVSSSNYKAFSATYVVQDAPYFRTFTAQELSQFGIGSSGTIYVRVYGDSFFSNDYVDPVSKKSVFPNLNPTTQPAVSITF